MADFTNVVFTYKGWPAGLRKSVINRILKQAFREIGEYWHEKYLPGHFTKAGAAKYGYTPRKGEGSSGKAFWRSYSGQKQKYKGHTRPLVFSGEGRRQALSTIKVSATSKGCKVKLPSKFNFRHPASKVNMRKEITAITSDEHARLAEIFELSIIRQLNELSETRTVKV